MSGIPEFNFPAFNLAEEELLALGYSVFNPAKKELERTLDKDAYKDGDAQKATETGFDFRAAYLWDVTKVIEADGIYMLKGWRNSAGAVGEHAVALAVKSHHPEYEIIYE